MGKKDDQLGMSFSRANGRLKKMYLLSLLQRLGEDDCYRCGEKIETIEELSIEHKQPWLNVDIGLFWDLSNIAHSHLSCNSAAGAINRNLRLGNPLTEERRAKGRSKAACTQGRIRMGLPCGCGQHATVM